MPRKQDDREERITQLQALAEEGRRELPQLDRTALESALMDLEVDERRGARWKTVGWIVAAVVVVGLILLFYRKMS